MTEPCAISTLSPFWIALQTCSVVLISFVLYYFSTGGHRPWAGIPIITLTGNTPSPWSGADPDYEHKGLELLAKGKATTDGCFQIKTGTGFKIIVPNRFANELRNHKALSIHEANRHEFLTDYRGFDGMRQGSRTDGLLPEVIRVKLTQSLGLVIDDIIDEGVFGIEHVFGNSTNWTECHLKDAVLDLVARVSTRVFTGKELSRDEAWIQIAKQNTLNTFAGAQDLIRTPRLLRPICQWLIPSIRELRREAANARKLLTPLTEKRLRTMAEETNHGKEKSRVATDYWAWVVEQAKGRPIDFTAGQLFLSIVAIHTSAEIATRCILQLCEMPELVKPLREEVLDILQQDGWAKTSLYKMKLLDSFIKEVHRTHPLAAVELTRYVLNDFHLSDGTKIPKGSLIGVLDDALWDADYYPEPERFDASRFVNLRQTPGEDGKQQYVALANHNLSFGLGEHACPGRFFAANEIKIILCLLLLGYDLESVPGKHLQAIRSGFWWIADPQSVIRIRRRQEEIDVFRYKTTK